MLAGVTGLVANSSALAAISDNIANVNTTAYKRNQVNFGSVVTAQIAGRYSAGGVSATSRQFVSQQGLIQAGTSSTDLAISGDGFFVTTQKAQGLTNADSRLFTRSGSFSVDGNGYMVNDAGLYLQGWPVKADGTFDINPSDLNKLSPINVKGLGSAVSPTTNVEIRANLNKGGVLSPGLATYNTAANSMAAYAATGTGTRPDFTMEMNVVDSSGATRKVAISLLKADPATSPNTWRAEIYAIPASDVAGVTNGQLAAGDLVFTPNGEIDFANAGTTLFGPAPGTPEIALGASSDAAGERWASALGVGAQTVSLDLTGLTQLSQASTVTAINSDGAGVGNVVGVEVGEDGIVSAIFDNAQVRTIAKVAIATFPNADGLQAVNGNAYRVSSAAGQMLIKEPGIGAGYISPSSLEASTVDLSAEFTALIMTQKAYSASSKIISTADQMLDELINIKR
jgi:flagellar hook protein FlgE